MPLYPFGPSSRDPWLTGLDQLLTLPNGEARWFDATRTKLEAAYTAAENPRAQSGFGGDAAYWESARRPIAAAIDRSGTFLDIGCAGGLLMESVVKWTAEVGHSIEPYGLDFSEKLVALAQQRYPWWADRIWHGNAISWNPPHRFDFVRAELVYVPPEMVSAFVQRTLDVMVAPGGSLILCSYGSSWRSAPRAERIGNQLRDLGFYVSGETMGTHNGVVVTHVAKLQAGP